jgi:hypothetical protein
MHHGGLRMGGASVSCFVLFVALEFSNGDDMDGIITGNNVKLFIDKKN